MWFMKFGQQFNFEVLCSLTLSREAAFFEKMIFCFIFIAMDEHENVLTLYDIRRLLR